MPSGAETDPMDVISAVVFYTVGAAGTVLLLSAISHAAPNATDLEFGVPLFGAAMVVALVRAIGAGRKWVNLVVVAACVLTIVGGYVTNAPLVLRWKVSEPAFERLIADPSAIHAPFRAGLFEIRDVDTSPGGYLFYDTPGDLSDTGDGIAYLPHGDGTGAFPDQDSFLHLDGPWYAWVGNS